MKFIPAVCIAHSVTSVTLDNRLCFRISAFKCRGHCESNICRDSLRKREYKRSDQQKTVDGRFLAVPLLFQPCAKFLPARRASAIGTIYGTKVCRYNWHSAGSLDRPFPMPKYKYIFQIKYMEAIFVKQHWETYGLKLLKR